MIDEMPEPLRKSKSLRLENQSTNVHFRKEPSPEKLITEGRLSHSKASNLKELIEQKYNFCSRLKANSVQNSPIRQRNSAQSPVHGRVLILAEDFCSPLSKSRYCQTQPKTAAQSNPNSPKIRPKFGNSQKVTISLGSKGKKQKDLANPIPRKRQVKDYQQCLRRIQMNTSYRGFNKGLKKEEDSSVAQFHKSFTPQLENYRQAAENKQEERRSLFKYIIERGFARKKQQKLARLKHQKLEEKHKFPTVWQHTENPVSSKNVAPSSFKRRAVIYSRSHPTNPEESAGQINPW